MATAVAAPGALRGAEGRNVKGRVIGALLAVVGKRVFGGQFQKTVKAIEARPAA